MIFNKLQFDDIDSKDHGIYITGSAAFNSPSRDVEMVTVPGRNGDLILDNGRYNNIEVTYPAGTFGNTEEDFRDKICNFRNLLASKKGYQRLTDTYNPDEYRMAAFVDAIEVEPVGHNIAGEFDIVFNCKPQRFLMSGEAAVEVTDGEEIFNPTPFDASPMIMAKGYGLLHVNGHEIEITNEELGAVSLLGNQVLNVNTTNASKQFTIDPALLNIGDTIKITGISEGGAVEKRSNTTALSLGTVTAVGGTGQIAHNLNTDIWEYSFNMGEQTFVNGTPSTVTGTLSIPVTYTESGTSKSNTIVLQLTIDYDGDATFTFQHTYTGDSVMGYRVYARTMIIAGIVGDSTLSTLGDPTYIDCDLGEVYKIEGDSFVSLNRLTDLGSDLPVLSPGNNLVEYDNTFTSVEIIPRWWRL